MKVTKYNGSEPNYNELGYVPAGSVVLINGIYMLVLKDNKFLQKDRYRCVASLTSGGVYHYHTDRIVQIIEYYDFTIYEEE